MNNYPAIDVSIRPHLVPFLFKETEGTEANYMNRTAKFAKISPFSSIGRFLDCQLVNYQKLGSNDKFIFYLTMERKQFNVYAGYIYLETDKVKEKLRLPENTVKYINNLIEDMFRIAFIYYVDGCVENNEESEVRRGIDKFIDKYDLLEVGFCNETLRRLYYRSQKKNTKMSRMQIQVPPRMINIDKKPCHT